MTKTLIAPSTELVKPLLAEAKAVFLSIATIETQILDQREDLQRKAWVLGALLTQMKEEIGHGKWILWLNANFAALGRTDEIRERNSQRCLKFFAENPPLRQINWSNPRNSSDLERFSPKEFTVESIRKLMWGYIPAKERPELAGDEDISPGAHHLTFVNQFSKYDRQLRSGHVEGFELDIFKREIEPMLRRIIELCGRDWFERLLA